MTEKETELHQRKWKKLSLNFFGNGTLDRMESSELYNLTWRTTTEFIIRSLRLKNRQRIFDAGFGWGRVIHGIKYYLREIEIEGVELTNEFSERALSLLEKYSIKSVKLHSGDILDLREYDSDSFDAIYSTRVLHYIVNKEKALDNLHRILKPSGKIIIIIPNRFCPYRWFTYHNPLYSILKLKNIMRGLGFQALRWGSIGFIPTFFGRFSHKSKLHFMEKIFQKIPALNKMGGLAYVIGGKSQMRDDTYFAVKVEKMVIGNIDRFLDTDRETLRNIRISDICRQNRYSSRLGGKFVLEYYDKNNNPKEKAIWVKKVEEPKKFFEELSLVYRRMEKYGLQAQVTKPYWYDLDLGVIYMDNFSGVILLTKTYKNGISFSPVLSGKFVQLFYRLGKWLQRYHEIMASDKTIGMGSISAQLHDAVEKDSYFSKNEKRVLMKHLDHFLDSPIKDLNFCLVRAHNDFSLRNIILLDSNFGIIDWDAMIHPEFPHLTSVWNEISRFLINLQAVLRFYPLTSKDKVRKFKEAFLQGYFEDNSLTKAEHFNRLFYIFTLRFFVGIDIDRTLPQIYRPNFGLRYIKMLKQNLLRGSSDITC